MSSASLSPPPLDVQSLQPNSAGKQPAAKLSRSTSSSLSPVKSDAKSRFSSSSIGSKEELLQSRQPLDLAMKEELVVATGSLPQPVASERIQDDWQVAYVWGFIVRFNQLERIRRLECLDDEPMANRPDDVLEGILIQFLRNLKPNLRNIDCTNIQHHLSNYITDMLHNSPEFTVWDRPWAANEEVRAGCCNSAPDRLEQGRLRDIGEANDVRVARNPIRQVEEKGGGLFELDWRERAKLLRQLVDWQLTHCDSIRNAINKEYKAGAPPKKDKAVPELALESIKTKPIGHDRNKMRIWSLDASHRLYRSGNPFKRPCPLITITLTKQQFMEYLEDISTYSSQTPPQLEAGKKQSQKKTSVAELAKLKKKLRGIEDEQKLAEAIKELLPSIEKEEQRVQRARKRIAAAAELASLAELRTTRTRRSARKVDYTYATHDDDDYDSGPSFKRRRVDAEDSNENSYAGSDGVNEAYDHRGRVIIPGERKSARGAGKAAEAEAGTRSTTGNGHRARNGARSSSGSASRSVSPKKKGMKGYEVIEEYVPFEKMTEKEKRIYLANHANQSRLDDAEDEGSARNTPKRTHYDDEDSASEKVVKVNGHKKTIRTESDESGGDNDMDVDEDGRNGLDQTTSGDTSHVDSTASDDGDEYTGDDGDANDDNDEDDDGSYTDD